MTVNLRYGSQGGVPFTLGAPWMGFVDCSWLLSRRPFPLRQVVYTETGTGRFLSDQPCRELQSASCQSKSPAGLSCIPWPGDLSGKMGGPLLCRTSGIMSCARQGSGTNPMFACQANMYAWREGSHHRNGQVRERHASAVRDSNWRGETTCIAPPCQLPDGGWVGQASGNFQQ